MHRYQRTDIPITDQGIVIQDDVWIGAGVTILDGFKIGHGSVIAAGAVVTKNIEPFSVMAGVPAHVLKRRRNADHLIEGKKLKSFHYGFFSVFRDRFLAGRRRLASRCSNARSAGQRAPLAGPGSLHLGEPFHWLRVH